VAATDIAVLPIRKRGNINKPLRVVPEVKKEKYAFSLRRRDKGKENGK